MSTEHRKAMRDLFKGWYDRISITIGAPLNYKKPLELYCISNDLGHILDSPAPLCREDAAKRRERGETVLPVPAVLWKIDAKCRDCDATNRIPLRELDPSEKP